jgi:DUF4097 and DUF4098 domain-containing protein YvlB
MEGARGSAWICVLLSCATVMAAAQNASPLRYTVHPGATVAVTNEYGAITVHSAAGNQVIVITHPHPAKAAGAGRPDAQVEAAQSGNRVEIHTRHSQAGASDSIDYDIQVPPDTSVVVRTSSGPVRVQNVSGGVSVESVNGSVDVRDESNGAVQVQTIEGPVTLTHLSGGIIQVRSVSGEVTLSDAAGPTVNVDTNGAPIHFRGGLPAGSSCELSTHAADIEVALPVSASVDVTASSVNGSVDDTFRLQPDDHPALALVTGKSFAGHANAGAATMKLRSFSGKITVEKQ